MEAAPAPTAAMPFDLSEASEYTIEVNPETLTAGKAELLFRCGVNRISLGVQSFDDRVLERMNRPTRRADVRKAYELLRRAGFGNIGIDLILGIGTEDVFKKDLEEAVLYGPEHISVYMLHIAEGTLLEGMAKKGTFREMGESVYGRLYEHTVRTLVERGYSWYEVSNFAKAGYQSRHNMRYWEGKQYIGTGLGAVSTIGTKRSRNTYDLEEYHRLVKKGIPPVTFSENLGERELFTERLMLGLRMRSGVPLAEVLAHVETKQRERVTRTIEECAKQGYVEERGGNLVLTVSGVLRADSIVPEILQAAGT